MSRPNRAATGLFGLAAWALALLLHADAGASVSLAVTWDALVRESSAAAVVTPVESRAVWEDGRICTYTRVHVERAVAGELGAGTDAWVRTLGGIVGKIGQIVDGEAVFSPGRPSLVFLRRGSVGAMDVTARGQGQFPVVADGDPSHPLRVMQSHTAGVLLPRPAVPGAAHVMLAAEMLHGRIIDEVARDVAAAWAPAHAR
jgi:hypothetical protein